MRDEASVRDILIIMFKTAIKLSASVLAIATTMSIGASAQQAASAKPASDIVVFTNGDQLTGKLERGVGSSIVFKSDMAGEVTIPLDKVKELHASGSYALLRNDVPLTKTPVKPGTIAVADGNVTVSPSAAPAETVPAKQVGYLIDDTTYQHELGHHAGFFDDWNGSITGGATLVRSSTNINTYTAALALVRAIPTVDYLPSRSRTTFNVQETYGKQTQVFPPPQIVTITSIFHADAEHDEYFSPRLYVLAETSFDHNYAQGLSLQAVYGGGIGWSVIKTAKQGLDLKMDVHYETQQYQTNNEIIIDPAAQPLTQKLIGSTFSESYHRNLPHGIVFSETGNALPAWNVEKDYSANGTVGLLMPVFKRFSLNFMTTDNFLNDPAPGYQKNSYQFVTGITYKLR